MYLQGAEDITWCLYFT